MKAKRPVQANGHDAHLRSVALQPLFRHFKGMHGFDEILSRNGIDAHPASDPYELIPLKAFLQVLEEAASFAKDPVLGARLGLTISPGELGPAGLLMMQSSTLRRGLVRYAESISALQAMTEMRLAEQDGVLDFTYQVNIADQSKWAQDAEMSLSSTCKLVRTCFSPRWKPLEVHFRHGHSPCQEQLEKIYRAPVRFGQSANRIIFSCEKIDVPFRVEDSELINVVSRHLGDLILERRGQSASWSSRVKNIVARKVGRMSCSLPDVARELGVTPRALQRLLAAEETSLRNIMRDHRREIVQASLESSGKNLSEIAWSLGYSDGTVLWRAYKQWTGSAPSAKRRPSWPDSVL